MEFQQLPKCGYKVGYIFLCNLLWQSIFLLINFLLWYSGCFTNLFIMPILANNRQCYWTMKTRCVFVFYPYCQIFVYLNVNIIKKCVFFFILKKCANLEKMSISEGYFIQLKPNFSMWLAFWLVLYAVVWKTC